uniref:RNA helicase n=1 Tax=Denticeps clupeoides TaxID=299321 RepID=A0AAY4BF79_9TELE
MNTTLGIKRFALKIMTELLMFFADNILDKNRTSRFLNTGTPQVPPMRRSSELECFRRTLPVYERQEELVRTIKANQVVLLVGETGSGKTTQLPQFLLDDCSRNGIPCRIFCTQPRRLASITVAERVAAERGESIGQTVGYQIRLESRVSPKTLLTFCTCGVLLRTLMAGDCALSTVTHVIMDEVHERDGLSDFLLTKMRDLLQKMPTLRLVLSSAALDTDLFVRYFGSCPVIHIKGRPFEVKHLFLEDILRTTGYANKDMLKYTKEMQKGESHEMGKLNESPLVQSGSSELSAEDQELLKAYHNCFDDEKVDLDLIMHLLFNICQSSDEGAVLIFLPGYDEIVSLYLVFTLHSNIQTSDQKEVLKKPPVGVRKIILSTNIAETSITVNDVVFVIDSGKVKEKSFDSLSNVTMLKMVWISKASALQRKGRAGRCRPGICFHLFSRLRYNNMLEHQVPQLLRMALQELCLHTKLLAPISCTVAEFLSKAPEPPHMLSIKNAVQMLKTIDAMDPWENLTELGYHLTDLPVEPHLGKMVLCAVVLKCLDPVLTIACALAQRDPFVLPAQASQKRAAMICRKRFSAGTFSDHMALLRAFQAWQKARSDGWERTFCEKNFLSQANMEIILGMRTQLLGFVRARGGGDIRDVNLNSENWAVVKAALMAGMYPNIIHVDRENCALMGAKEKRVRLHPTSVISQMQLKKVSLAMHYKNNLKFSEIICIFSYCVLFILIN